MKLTSRPAFWVVIVTGLAIALATIALAGCSPSAPGKSREQVWIETHPTSAGLLGQCVEFDGEPCDDDPFDLDDLTEVDSHKTPGVKKPSPRPVKTAAQPKTTRGR